MWMMRETGTINEYMKLSNYGIASVVYDAFVVVALPLVARRCGENVAGIFRFTDISTNESCDRLVDKETNSASIERSFKQVRLAIAR